VGLNAITRIDGARLAAYGAALTELDVQGNGLTLLPTEVCFCPSRSLMCIPSHVATNTGAETTPWLRTHFRTAEPLANLLLNLSDLTRGQQAGSLVGLKALDVSNNDLREVGILFVACLDSSTCSRPS
jgi:hypothetical protein